MLAQMSHWKETETDEKSQAIPRNLSHFARNAKQRQLSVSYLRRLVADLSSAARESVRVGYVMGKVTLGQDIFERFCFPCQFSFHLMFHFSQLLFDADTRGQAVYGLNTKKIQFDPTLRIIIRKPQQ
jgi:hypothetical protein